MILFDDNGITRMAVKDASGNVINHYRPLVIGLFGAQGVGKSHVARMVKEKFNFERFSFANILRERFQITYGFDARAYPKNDKRPELNNKTIREVLQRDGSNGRKLDKDIWLNVLKRHPSQRLIIDDVRYQNEADYIQSLDNGYLIHLWPEDEPEQSGSAHESEQDWHYFEPDAEVEYNHDWESLGRVIDEISRFNDG